MKSPEAIIKWCEMMLKLHPNIEDANYFRAIIKLCKETQTQESTMVKIQRNTAGDSRVQSEVPTREAFDNANISHIKDVNNLAEVFCSMLKASASKHDWTKVEEPYATMFYDDMCATIRGERDFFDGEWSKLHYYEKERHHLKRSCPDDVTLIDVIEMVCDCVSAGLARSGNVYDLDIDESILKKALNNTVDLLKAQCEVIN